MLLLFNEVQQIDRETFISAISAKHYASTVDSKNGHEFSYICVFSYLFSLEACENEYTGRKNNTNNYCTIYNIWCKCYFDWMGYGTIYLSYTLNTLRYSLDKGFWHLSLKSLDLLSHGGHLECNLNIAPTHSTDPKEGFLQKVKSSVIFFCNEGTIWYFIFS